MEADGRHRQRAWGEIEQKGLQDRNSPRCTLSQNGYGDVITSHHTEFHTRAQPLEFALRSTWLSSRVVVLLELVFVSNRRSPRIGFRLELVFVSFWRSPRVGVHLELARLSSWLLSSEACPGNFADARTAPKLRANLDV